VDFLRLKLMGFKSFVESSELIIEPGLTGIIGPNGCGKSNLLESLRWVMGANSAKALRGQDMDDVIFAGTQNRAPRQWAEVSLSVSGALGKAPAPFHDQDQLEVKRRIQRGEGSTYRINNKEVRAKDVQLLFADASTGANSPALVRQGQIADLIASKPANRRRVLEEAANISGLSGRRSEAEYRLNAAEANLMRLDDSHQSLETNLNRLKKEARQAEVFRKLSQEIRILTKAHLLARFDKAYEDYNQARTTVKMAEHAYMTLNHELKRQSQIQESLEVKSIEIEEELVLAQALSNRLLIKEERLKADKAEIIRESQRLKDEDERHKRDKDRALALIDDARAQIERLQGLLKEENETYNNTELNEQCLQEQHSKAQTDLKAAEAHFETLSKQYHSAQERRRSDTIRLSEATNRLERMTGALKDVESQKQALHTQAMEQSKLEYDGKAIEDLRAQIQNLSLAIEIDNDRLGQLHTDVYAAKTRLAEKTNDKGAFEAEMIGLKKLLDANKRDLKPISDLIEVQKGYELALASALGDDLNWGLARIHNVNAIGFWNEDFEPESLIMFFDQMGIVSLESFIKSYPRVLKSRLLATGLVSADQGDALHTQLPVGARLVSREGDLWRWDGLCLRSRAPKPSAIRLSQRNRLQDITQKLESLEADILGCKNELEAKQVALATFTGDLEKKKKQQQNIEKTLRLASQTHDIALAEAARQQARLEAITENYERLSAEHSIIYEQWQAINRLSTDENEPIHSEEAMSEAKAELKNAQEIAQHARSQLEWYHKNKEAKFKRKHQLMSESTQWIDRIQSAESEKNRIAHDMVNLKKRANDYELRETQLKPQETALGKEKKQIELRLHKARTVSEEHKSALSQSQTSLRLIEKETSASKETLTTATVRTESSLEALREIEKIIQFETKETPDDLRAELKSTPHSIPRDLSGLESLIKGLKDQRDQMGSVNLRAEDDVKEAQSALGLLINERNDLLVAIKKLRDAIEALNSEGRTKLLSAFDIINDHFKTLFETLFGGGTASLALVESDDPLKAGLEIFACPPGKRLSTMSLMSGGEQALTATALIFAVFLANPAPVCVLDEVDAPLDDANVDRYCSLLDAMRQRTKTRFLVITHNPVTMSKMDRLFGVTMQEGGVSQLLSLRLEAAKALVEDQSISAHNSHSLISEAV